MSTVRTFARKLRGLSPSVAVLGFIVAAGVVPARSADAQIRLPAAAAPTGLHAVAVAASPLSAQALDADGRVYAWGQNQDGQLGDGGTTYNPAPEAVLLPAGAPAGFRFTAIAAGSSGALGIGSDGALYGWGLLTPRIQATRPQRIQVLPGAPADFRVIAVASGDFERLVLGSNGVVYRWKAVDLQDTIVPSAVPMPAGTPAGFKFTAIAAGDQYDLALGSDGGIYAWGDNSSGQLGDGTTTNRTVPVAIHAVTSGGVQPRFAAIAAGYVESLAVDSAGKLYQWGGYQNPKRPTVMSLPAGAGTDVRVIAVATSESTDYALTADGRIYAWGDGSEGQLGRGTPTHALTIAPVRLPLGAPPDFHFTAISAKVNSAYALGSDGRVYDWGVVGDSKTDRYLPVAVPANQLQAMPEAVRPVASGPAGSRYFRQTHHTLAGPFLAFWQQYGGVNVLGYPLSEPFTADGQTIQYTERFALALTNGVVTPLPLGRLLYASPTVALPATAGPAGASRAFPATNQSLSGVFLTYWQQHNGATLLGAPISGVRSETNGDGSGRAYAVQWFERGRLEYHPEASAPYRVELGQLGRQALRSFGWIS